MAAPAPEGPLSHGVCAWFIPCRLGSPLGSP
jgi:hypothetical protein